MISGLVPPQFLEQLAVRTTVLFTEAFTATMLPARGLRGLAPVQAGLMAPAGDLALVGREVFEAPFEDSA